MEKKNQESASSHFHDYSEYIPMNFPVPPFGVTGH